MTNKVELNKLTKKELGYLLGFYVGDGNIFIKENIGVYRLRIYTYYKEKDVQKKVIDIISKIINNVRSYDDKDNTYTIEVHSKDLIYKIKKLANKKGLVNLKNKNITCGFIEGLIDSDGYVKRNYVEITTSVKELMENITNILNQLKLKFNIRTYKSPLSNKIGWRVGFSLNSKKFYPTKWLTLISIRQNEGQIKGFT